MPEIICIGSALVDIFIHSHHFAMQADGENVMLCHVYGDKIEAEQFQVVTGGGASNTAVAFRRLGFETGIVAELGQDNLARLVEDELRNENVDTSCLIHEKKEQTGGSVIMIGPDGGLTVMVHRGAAAMLDVSDVPLETLAQTRWLHLSSIGGRLDVLKTLFELVRSKNVGLSWNPGKSELHLLATGQLPIESVAAHVIIMNEQEWESIKPLQSSLVRQAYQIIITDGARGGRVLVPGQEEFEYHSPSLVSVDDTGAGDAFASGYITAYLNGFDVARSVRWGVANAVSNIQVIGAKAGLLTRSEIERIA